MHGENGPKSPSATPTILEKFRPWLCPTNCICCHTKFCKFSMRFVFRMAVVYNTFFIFQYLPQYPNPFMGFAGVRNVRFWTNNRNRLAGAAFRPTNLSKNLHPCPTWKVNCFHNAQFRGSQLPGRTKVLTGLVNG